MEALKQKINSYLAIVLVLLVALAAAMLVFASGGQRTLQIGRGEAIVEER